VAMIYRSNYFRTLYVKHMFWLQWIALLTLVSFIFLTDPILSSKWMLTFGYTLLSIIYGTILLISILGPAGSIRYVTNLSWLRSLGENCFCCLSIPPSCRGFCFLDCHRWSAIAQFSKGFRHLSHCSLSHDYLGTDLVDPI